jgi:adenosylmethionine-8-amino-7-oxononanoate aminotransferase
MSTVPEPRQPRKHAVLCTHCFHGRTWNASAVCELCTRKEAVAAARADEARLIVSLTLRPTEETP